MKKKWIKFAAAALAAAFCLSLVPSVRAARTNREGDIMIRVGLASPSNVTSNSALGAAHLENNTGYGAGYRFGYYDDSLNFVELGRTDEDVHQAAVVKTQNMYYGRDPSLGKNTYSSAITSSIVVGCYHIQLPGSYRSLEEAAEAARPYGGFPAWIDGTFYARVGSYTSQEEARRALDSVGAGEVVGTSSYGLSVVRTGTAQILFQFDDSTLSLGILPDVTGADDVRTWFSGFKYRGGFSYRRTSGGNITVVNVVDLENYVKGVVCYEMGRAWPLEALKTQAVCARTYVLSHLNGYGNLGFDVSNSTYSQVYNGVGNGKDDYGPSENSDRAVEETRGLVVKYNGVLADTPYSSSHGGASEDARYIWGTDTDAMPYLKGVVDPYEQTVDDRNSMSPWTVTYSAAQLTSQVQKYGFGVNSSVDHLELTYSDLGNVIQAKIVYANGQSNTVTPRSSPGIRSTFGLRSIRFTVNGQTPAGSARVEVRSGSADRGTGYAVNDSDTLRSLEGTYVISGEGSVSTAGDSLYTISGTGTTEPASAGGSPGTGTGAGTTLPQGSGTVVVSGSTYVFEGGGYGHQVGMSQFGANAMARLGFTYNQIVTFYFPGTDVVPY